jgi:ParB family transcriptional regulator, chromosome partitioning protein
VRPELIQIENCWRNAREQRPGAVQRGHFREIETVVENPDAEPAPSCAAAKPAIIIYGKRVGTTLTVCTDDDCPVHDPRAEEEQAANPAPSLAPAPEAETQEEAEERQRNYEQQRKEYEQEQERRLGKNSRLQPYFIQRDFHIEVRKFATKTCPDVPFIFVSPSASGLGAALSE